MVVFNKTADEVEKLQRIVLRIWVRRALRWPSRRLVRALLIGSPGSYLNNTVEKSEDQCPMSNITNDELRKLNENRHIQQIAWLTHDLERSMQAWIDVLRIGPWRVFRFTDQTVKNLRVGGKLVEGPFEFRIGITHVGKMELELIQPVRGPMIYEADLKRRGPGLHHIKEKILDDKIDKIVAEYEAGGLSVTQSGQFIDDLHFYLDTENKLDFVYELGNCPYQDLPAEMVSIYPPE